MSSPPAHRNGSIPTVLLVHDAFTTTYCWAGTIEGTSELGSDVLAVPNPLRRLASDADWVAALAATIDGPVVLVGHGYGGGVITVAGAQAANVVGLVYVAGFALAENESCIDIVSRSGDGRFLNALSPVRLHTAGRPGTEIYLKREAFAQVFAADLPSRLAATAAASQSPITAEALQDRPSAVGWRDLPCWYLVATADRVIDVAAQRAMAVRAGAVTVEIDGSHAVPMSAPTAVADLVRAATTALTSRN